MNSYLQNAYEFVSTHWSDLLIPLALFVGVVLAGLAIRRVVFGRLRTWVTQTESPVDNVLVDSLRGPVLLWIIILGIYVATDMSRLPAQALRWSERALIVLWIVSLTLVLSRLAGRLVQSYSGHGVAGSLPQTLATLVVALLGGLTLLNEFGISITPILTALGVGGIAIALALQDTLSNLFAGFYVSVAGHVRVDDFIQLETGQQGYVSDIGWRSTTLRDRANNLIAIPNNKLAQSIVINYHLPEKRMQLRIPVNVSYASDPDQVERVLVDVARSAADEVPGLLTDPAPVALLLPGFGEHSLEFSLICAVTDYEAQFPVQHALRKRILRRLQQEGIESMPVLARTVEYRDRPPK